MNRHSEKEPTRRIRRLFQNSAVLSAIDRFSATVYGWLKNGFFGHLLSAYPKSRATHTAGASGTDNPFRRRILMPIRRTASVTAEGSAVFALIRHLIAYLLKCRLRVYGVFLISFGLYSAAAYLLSHLGDVPSTPMSNLIAAGIMVFAAAPLLSQSGSLSDGLLASAIAPPVCAIFGIRRKELRVEGLTGRSNIAFIFGMFFGAVTYFIPTLYILFGIAAIFLLFCVFMTPECGVAALFLLMPFLPTMVLLALVIYTAACYGVKLLLGKRDFHLEPVDIAALLFAMTLLCSGVISFSRSSLKPSLVLVCFIGGYFLTVLLIRTKEWLTRCTNAALLAATLVSLYGILQYLTGSFGGSNAWTDTTMFEEISGRIVSTLENPNMLAEYLILLFPLAAARLLTRGSAGERGAALCAAAAIGVAIILTWSRGAWLGLLFGGFVFLLIWSRYSMYLLFAGVTAVPFLPLVLPDSIIHRFTSIGNLADTSTSYRVNIWRGTVHMLEDYWHCGIGIGEGAWDTVYPRYALAAIETAPHSHNLYLQTWVESGIVGLLLLLAFLWLLCQTNFSFYRDLSSMRKTIIDSISVTHLKPTAHGNAPVLVTMQRDSTARAAAEKEITVLRMQAAAPLCGILATLVQGLTDYTWYNYRVYLMFWLIAGLSAAYTRMGQAELSHIRNLSTAHNDTPEEASADIPLTPHRKRNTRKGNEKGTAAHV